MGDLLFHGDEATQKKLGVQLTKTGMVVARAIRRQRQSSGRVPKFQEQIGQFATPRHDQLVHREAERGREDRPGLCHGRRSRPTCTIPPAAPSSILEGIEAGAARDEARSCSRPIGLSRRAFLGLASAAVGLSGSGRPGAVPAPPQAPACPPARGRASSGAPPAGDDPQRSQGPHRRGDGTPATPEHHITSVQVVNGTDPVPLKGTFHFTPGTRSISRSRPG